MKSSPTAFVAAVALLGAAGCQQEIPLPKPSKRSSVQVALPPAPSLTKRSYASHHADGALTVEGLLRQRDAFLGKDVQVRGVVKRLVKCPAPPPAPAEPDAGADADAPPPPPPRPPRTCDPPPHAYLVDRQPASDRELLVYGSMWSPLADFELGQEVTIDGHFDFVSKDHVFLRQAGLLILEDRPPEEPAAAPVEGDAAPDQR